MVGNEATFTWAWLMPPAWTQVWTQCMGPVLEMSDVSVVMALPSPLGHSGRFPGSRSFKENSFKHH